MKRSEAIDLILDYFVEYKMHQTSASKFLDFLVNEIKMLPPVRNANKIPGVYSYVNQWEPEAYNLPKIVDTEACSIPNKDSCF